MVEQLELEYLVKEEERHLGRIGRIQQLADGLDIGPEDLSQRNLAQARATVRYLRATSYIERIQQQRLGPISAEIDRQALTLAEDHESQLQSKEIDLRVVETASVSPFTTRDIMRFRQEVLDFRQRPLEDPLLARGIRLYRQDRELPQPEAAEPIEEIKLTYADIEQRGTHPSPTMRVLMEGLLPFASTADPDHVQSTLSGPDWSAPVWPDIPWDQRRDRLKSLVSDMRHLLSGTDLSIISVRSRGAASHIPGNYYLKVEPPQPKVEIPKFRPKAYKIPKEPFPPPPLQDYRSSLQEVIASFTSLDEDTRVLLGQFQTSPAASYAILNAMVKFNAHPRSEQETKEFYRFLAGDFLAELGNIQLQLKYQDMGLTLLSPYEKFILFRNAHQEKAIVDPSGYGTSFEIVGVPYLPDGLVICETKQALEVAAIVEYKNVTTRDRNTLARIIEQHAHFTPDGLEHQLRLTDPDQPIDPLFLGQLIHDKLRPNLSPKPLVVSPKMRIVYAVPESVALPFENIEPEYVHISSGEIGRFLEWLTTALKK